ncbi:MAG: hypothetical protein WD512_14450 [Candidatus Paceibacterota bacterium]
MLEDNLNFNSLALAKEQLEVSIELFLSERSYAAALTLAGAAEEIFGVECRNKGLEPFNDWMFNNTEILFKYIYGKEKTKKLYYQDQNAVRNALKHLNAKNSTKKPVNFQDATCWMIVRADYNAELLKIHILGRDDFNDWFFENIVGEDYA